MFIEPSFVFGFPNFKFCCIMASIYPSSFIMGSIYVCTISSKKSNYVSFILLKYFWYSLHYVTSIGRHFPYRFSLSPCCWNCLDLFFTRLLGRFKCCSFDKHLSFFKFNLSSSQCSWFSWNCSDAPFLLLFLTWLLLSLS